MLTLTALNGQDKGRVFQLTGEQPELLGRQAPTIKLTDAQTSRKHAEILLQNNTWLVRDLESTNGSWVNGQKITHITELEVGDRIVLGRHQFRVTQITDLPAPTPQPQTPALEPAIGEEDLADMGVDLSESLSADLLEEAGELPEVSDEALIDQDDLPATPTEAPPPAAPAAKQIEDDELIDLDALLNEAPSPPPEVHPPEVGPPAEAPVVTPESPSEELPAEEEVSQQDVADEVDHMQTSGAAEEAISDDVQPSIEPDDDESGVELPEVELQDEVMPAAEFPGAGTDDVPHDEPTETEPAEPEPAEAEPEPVTDEADDDVLDLDALLDDSPDVADSAGPTDAEPEAPEEQPDQPEPTSEVGDQATDDLIDIDILATASPISQDADQAPGEPAPPPVESDTTDELQSSDEPAEPEPPQPTEPDLNEPIHEDELAGIGSDEQADSPDDSISAFLDELGADEADEPDEAAAPEVEAADQHESDDEAPLAEDASEPTEDEIAPDEPEDQALPAPDEPTTAQEQALLLSEAEQTEAVKAYKRSKVMPLVILFVVLILVAAGGYLFGYPYLKDVMGKSSQPEREAPVAIQPTAEQPIHDSATDTGDNPADTQKLDASTNSVTDRKPTQPTTESVPAVIQPYRDRPDDIAADPTVDAFEDVPLKPGNATGSDESGNSTEPPPAATVAPPDQPERNAEPDRAETPTEPVIEPIQTKPESTDHSETTPPPDTDHQPAEARAEDSTGVIALLDAAVAPDGAGANEAKAVPFGDAHKVVYLVDASGSLVDSFPRVLEELESAVTALPKAQAFTVIFFGADGVIEPPPDGLRLADVKNKRELRTWLANDNVSAWGRGDALKALRRAVAYQPNDIVILSDNLIGGQATKEQAQETLDQIDKIVGDRVEKIDVIQFFDRDPQHLLKQIAERFNGRYDWITSTNVSATRSADGESLPIP